MNATGISSTEWLLEIVLMVLLAATMFHALRLQKALGMLRRDRAALEELVTGFNESTRQADEGIERLRAAADGAGRQIARQVDQARSLKSDLEFLTGRGEKIADQLDGLVRRAKPAELVAPEPMMRPVAQGAPQPAVGRSGDPEPDMKLRSQAEKDLLRALRMAR